MMNIIYINIFFYLFYIYGLVGSAIKSFSDLSGTVETQYNYDFVGLFIAVLIAITIIGLIKRKPWAYQMALGINAAIFLIPIFYIVGVLIMLQDAIELVELINMSKLDLFVGSIFFVFWLALYRSTKIKKAYNKLIQRDF